MFLFFWRMTAGAQGCAETTSQLGGPGVGAQLDAEREQMRPKHLIFSATLSALCGSAVEFFFLDLSSDAFLKNLLRTLDYPPGPFQSRAI